MREILFRGKKIYSDEWVDGSLVRFADGCDFICVQGENIDFLDKFAVIPETIGQYTGLTDKNGKKIFEGDIVHCWGGEYAFGFWEHNNTFAFTDISDYMQMGELSESEFVEVIGNIHDNPELCDGNSNF